MEVNRCWDPGDGALVESSFHPCECGRAIRRPDDQLADQGVIEGRDVVAGIDMAVDADSRASRLQPASNSSRGWPEIVLRIFGVDSALDRMTVHLNVFLAHTDRLPSGDA